MLGGKIYREIIFLLCKECHQESCDFDDRYFYAYIIVIFMLIYIIWEKINIRLLKNEIDDLCKQSMKWHIRWIKNIPTIDKGVEKLSLNVKKKIAY